jgi:hypothetical protein
LYCPPPVALVCNAIGRAHRVSVLPRAAAQRQPGRCRDGRRVGASASPGPAQPGCDDHALSQHDAGVPRHYAGAGATVAGRAGRSVDCDSRALTARTVINAVIRNPKKHHSWARYAGGGKVIPAWQAAGRAAMKSNDRRLVGVDSGCFLMLRALCPLPVFAL